MRVPTNVMQMMTSPMTFHSLASAGGVDAACEYPCGGETVGLTLTLELGLASVVAFVEIGVETGELVGRSFLVDVMDVVMLIVDVVGSERV